jgi:hypothetical protein
MAWLGRKKLAFIPLSRTNIQQPDVIPPDWSGQIRQRLLFDPATDPTTGDPIPGADRSVRAYFHTVSSGLADLDVVVLPAQTIAGQDVKPDALEATMGAQLRSEGFVGAAIVMLGGPGGGQTAQLSNFAWSRFSMSDDLGNWAGELIHQTNLCNLPDLFDFAGDYPSDENMGPFDQEAGYQATHFSAWTKRAVGWLNPSTVVRHPGGVAQYTLHSVSLIQPPPTGRSAAVQIGAKVPYLMVEARLQADQFDINIPNEGVIVYRVQTTDPLGNAQNKTAPLALLTKTALTAGQSFTTDGATIDVGGAVLGGGFSVTIHGQSSWNHADLTSATRAPAAAGDPAGYTWDVDSTQHVVYRGTDSHIHELWFNGTWNHADLTRAPVAAGDPAGYTWDVDSTQHVVYRGTNNQIHELWFNGTWNHADLTSATGAPAAAGNPAGYTWDVDSTQHVVYRGTDNHIHELWFNGTWNRADLTGATGAPGAAGDPAGYTWDVDSTQHVVYRSINGHIHELWFNGTWNHADLTSATGAPAAAGNPAGYTWDVDSTQHVVYRGTDNHIHELWFNGTWNHADLTGSPAAAGDPAGYTWDVDSTQHVVYRGTDNHIHELWFDGTWNHADLTSATGAPAAAGNPAGYTWDVDSTQHVVYRGTDNHIHELWFG